ncbi:recombinase family protein [Microvirga aerophila]|uniref:recombinase family protein n=1 Tax=Microvirga aerophila TaxID=670291 RepID=UPI0035A2318D
MRSCPIIEELRETGAVSLRQIAAGLNDKGIKTARGGAWSPVQVQRVIERVNA